MSLLIHILCSPIRLLYDIPWNPFFFGIFLQRNEWETFVKHCFNVQNELFRYIRVHNMYNMYMYVGAVHKQDLVGLTHVCYIKLVLKLRLNSHWSAIGMSEMLAGSFFFSFFLKTCQHILWLVEHFNAFNDILGPLPLFFTRTNSCTIFVNCFSICWNAIISTTTTKSRWLTFTLNFCI